MKRNFGLRIPPSLMLWRTSADSAVAEALADRCELVGGLVALGLLISVPAVVGATPREDYDSAEKLAGDKQFEQAFALFQKVGNDESGPRDLRSWAFERIGAWSSSRGMLDQAIEAYLKAVELTDNDTNRIGWQLQLSTWYMAQGKPQDARAILEAAASKNEVQDGAYAAQARLGLATLDLQQGDVDAAIARYKAELKRPDTREQLWSPSYNFLNALPELKGADQTPKLAEETVAARPEWRVACHTELLLIGTRTYAKKLNDLGKAEAMCREAIKVAESDPQGAVGQACNAYRELAGIQVGMGQKDKALATLNTCLDKYGHAAPQLATIVQSLLELTPSKEVQTQLCARLRKDIATGLEQGNLAEVEVRQLALVKVLVNLGSKDALPEARALLYTCSSSSVQAAIDLIVAAFKRTDLSLGRANSFLKFQRFGAAGEDGKLGTEDDLENVLEKIPPQDNAERVALYGAALDKQPATYRGYQQRSTVCLYLERPLEAFQMRQMAFQLCPNSQGDLQAATDALTGLVIRLTKDVAGAEQLVQYLMFGEAGRDGRTGTADDLVNPLPEIEKKLAGANGRPAAATAKVE